MSAEAATYLDSSAIVKLVVRERESAALMRYLPRRRPLVSSALARTEVARALLPLGAAAQQRGQEVLDRLELIRVNDRVLATAGAVLPPDVRSLDAIHIATASLLGRSLRRFVTYDARMASAARALGLPVASPKG
jgi:predicted nucleic acid-binding protein